MDDLPRPLTAVEDKNEDGDNDTRPNKLVSLRSLDVPLPPPETETRRSRRSAESVRSTESRRRRPPAPVPSNHSLATSLQSLEIQQLASKVPPRGDYSRMGSMSVSSSANSFENEVITKLKLRRQKSAHSSESSSVLHLERDVLEKRNASVRATQPGAQSIASSHSPNSIEQLEQDLLDKAAGSQQRASRPGVERVPNESLRKSLSVSFHSTASHSIQQVEEAVRDKVAPPDRAILPGVISVPNKQRLQSESTRSMETVEQDLLEKANAARPRNNESMHSRGGQSLENLEHDVLEKSRHSTTRATVPGAVSVPSNAIPTRSGHTIHSSMSQLEQDLHVKARLGGVGMDSDDSISMSSHSSVCDNDRRPTPKTLSRLEQYVADKLQAKSAHSAESAVSNLERDVTEKIAPGRNRSRVVPGAQAVSGAPTTVRTVSLQGDSSGYGGQQTHTYCLQKSQSIAPSYHDPMVGPLARPDDNESNQLQQTPQHSYQSVSLCEISEDFVPSSPSSTLHDSANSLFSSSARARLVRLERDLIESNRARPTPSAGAARIEDRFGYTIQSTSRQSLQQEQAAECVASAASEPELAEVEAGHGAVLVTEPSVIHPASVHIIDEEEDVKDHRVRNWCIVSATGIAAVLLVVGIIFGARMAKKDEPAATIVSTPSPTASPSASPTLGVIDLEAAELSELITTLEPLSGRAIFSDKFSPQYRAANWLIDEGIVSFKDDPDRFRQRYILGVLFYTALSKTWTQCEFDRGDCVDGVFPWLSPESECNWLAVGCNDNGQVVTLNFDKSTLRLSNEVLSAGEAEFLPLGISGTLPRELSSLSSLVFFFAEGYNIRGSVESLPFSSLPELQRLYLGFNELFGDLILDGYPKLEELSMPNADLAGTLPLRIESLKLVYLQRNRFSGTIPGTVVQSETLQTLDVSNNQLYGTIPPGLFESPSLESLRVGNPSITGSIPSNLSTNFRDLYLGNSQMSGTIPSIVYRLPRLQTLDLRNAAFSGVISEDFGLLNRTLRVLDLSNNQFEGSIPAALDGLRLRYLDLSGNAQVTGRVSQALCDRRRGGNPMFLNVSCPVACNCCGNYNCR